MKPVALIILSVGLVVMAGCNTHENEIDGNPYLFSYFEYTGNDFDGDMKKMAADSLTRFWWQHTDPTQIPLPAAADRKQIWSDMEEVFHTD
jgi:L-rhamnose mutarotase